MGFLVDQMSLGASFLRVFWSPLPTLIPTTSPHLLITWHYIVSIMTASFSNEPTEKQSSVMWLHVVWQNVPRALEASAASDFKPKDILRDPDDGGSHLLWNVRNFPSDCMVTETRTVTSCLFADKCLPKTSLKICHIFSRQPCIVFNEIFRTVTLDPITCR